MCIPYCPAKFMSKERKPSMTKPKKRMKGCHRNKYRKVFHLATEGKVTEKEYFSHIKLLNDYIHFNFILKDDDDNRSPLHLKKCMENFLQENKINNRSEAWLVFDVDQWNTNHIKETVEFGKKNNVKIAISNPKFEYWILFHFEKPKKFQKKRRYTPT